MTMMAPVDWFGLPPEGWAGSSSRGFSMVLWRVDRTKTVAFKAEARPDTHLVCIHLDGRMDWSAATNDRSYRRPCLADTFCIARAGESAEVEYGNAHCGFVHFCLPVGWFESEETGLADRRADPSIELLDPMNARAPTVARLARRAVAALQSGGTANRLEIEAAGLALAALLVRDHSTARPAPIRRGGLSPAVLRRVLDYIEAHLADGPSLGELAAIAGLTAPHFCRAFREETGLPPQQYQIRLRIGRATLLLADRRLSVADVGAAVGYDDPSYFSRVFAKTVGVPPRVWRAKHALA